MGKVERVARAICNAAASEIVGTCTFCKGDCASYNVECNDECKFWKTFRGEARAAIRAMNETDKE